MQRRLPLLLLLLVVALLGVAVAGCGGDDESASDEPDVTATDTNPGDDLDEDPTTTDEDDENVEPNDVASADDCRELANVAVNLQKALGGTGGEDLQKTKEFLEEFAERTPEDIRDDFRVIADAYAKLVEALEGVDLTGGQPDPEALQRLQEVTSEIDQQRLTEANENIARWVRENCQG